MTRCKPGRDQDRSPQRDDHHDGGDADVAQDLIVQFGHARAQVDRADGLSVVFDLLRDVEVSLIGEYPARLRRAASRRRLRVRVTVGGKGLARSVVNAGKFNRGLQAQGSQQLGRCLGILEGQCRGAIGAQHGCQSRYLLNHRRADHRHVVGHEADAREQHGHAAGQQHEQGQLGVDRKIFV